MKSAARIGDHPLHPMMIVVPAGAFITALVMDLVYLFGGAELWWNATVPVMIVGLAGAALAAIPGLIDLFSVARSSSEETYRRGLTHLGLNVLVIGVFLINVLMRFGAPAPAEVPVEFWLSVLGVLLLAASGWQGWWMVYRGHMGVDERTPPEQLEREREGPEPTTTTEPGEPSEPTVPGGETPH